MRAILITVLTCLTVAASAAAEEHWPQFRGPEGAGATSHAAPGSWSPESGIAWRSTVGGVAWSQPIVWGDRVFVTTAETQDQPKPKPGDYTPGVPLGFSALLRGRNPFGTGGSGPPEAVYRWKLLAVDLATGGAAWEQTVREARPRTGVHGNNTFASESPATDGERIVASFGANGLYCYSTEGDLLWERDLGAPTMQFGWGTGSSPIIHGDLVYVQCDNDEQSFLVALDKHSGEDRWRIERDEDSNWCSPYIWRNRLRTELVAGGGSKVRSYDPETGALLWQAAGGGRCSATPIGDADRLYFDSADRISGMNGYVVAVRAGAEGDIAPTEDPAESPIAWTRSLRGTRVASPAICDGRLYVLAQKTGIVHCLDAATGEPVYRGRIPQASGFTASPVVYGDQIYCLDEDGTTHVLAAGDELNVLASNAVTDAGEMFWASPAPAAGRLVLRSSESLYCVE